jgi:hypothetical protein
MQSQRLLIAEQELLPNVSTGLHSGLLSRNALLCRFPLCFGLLGRHRYSRCMVMFAPLVQIPSPEAALRGHRFEYPPAARRGANRLVADHLDVATIPGPMIPSAQDRVLLPAGLEPAASFELIHQLSPLSLKAGQEIGELIRTGQWVIKKEKELRLLRAQVTAVTVALMAAPPWPLFGLRPQRRCPPAPPPAWPVRNA